MTRKPLTERTHGQANMPQKVACIWREIGVPVIAAAHGFTLGGGFQIFMGADIRFAAPGTKFSIMEIKWGLVPDMGTTHVMARLAREDILKELAMTGRIFDADEALEIGFLTRIHDDPVAHAMEVAQQIAARNPKPYAASSGFITSLPTVTCPKRSCWKVKFRMKLSAGRTKLRR